MDVTAKIAQFAIELKYAAIPPAAAKIPRLVSTWNASPIPGSSAMG